MKARGFKLLGYLMLAAALFLIVPTGAFAAGATQGTSVQNQATLTFTVSGVPQPTVSNSVSFTVDRKITFTVTMVSGANVQANLVNAPLAFDVQNLSNDTVGFMLSSYASVTDDFNMNNVEIYTEDGTTPGFQIGEDNAYTLGLNMGDLAADATQRVYIVSDTPGTVSNGQTAVYHLIANATTASTNNLITNTAGANTAGVDTVLAEAAGTVRNTAGAADVAFNGVHSASATYTVASAVVSFSKGAAIVWDPANYNNGNQKAIPGAIIEYTITINNANTASASAVLSTIFDDLSTTSGTGGLAITTYKDGGLGTATPTSSSGDEFRINCTTSSADRACDAGFVYGSAGDPGYAYTAMPNGNVTLTLTTILGAEGTHAAGEIKPNSTVVIKYQAVIQ